MNRSAFVIGVFMVVIGVYMAFTGKGANRGIGFSLLIMGLYLAFTFRKISLA